MKLEAMNRQLPAREKAILASLQKCRYLTTDQIRRLHFTDNDNRLSALRTANNRLSYLKERNLIGALGRRIGGVRGGSGATVFALTSLGCRLLNLDNPDQPRKRFIEPSPAFLNHTLAVAEAYLQFIEICARHGLELAKAELEPVCWREYEIGSGKPAILKPDLFAVTASEKYEDAWFIEVDLATESPGAILEKCRRYVRYCQTGREQKALGMFPLVVWVVPSAARKESLRRNIAECRNLPRKTIFQVITPDELEGLIQKGGP